MSGRERRTAADYWDAADEHGVVSGDTLPAPVRDAMQQVVDSCEWVCGHVESAADLPAGVLARLCIAGAGAISCLQPTCILDLHDVAYRQQARSCTLCGHRQLTGSRATLTLSGPRRTPEVAVR